MTMTQKELEALPYRMGVGVMLLNAANQVFVGKRIDTRSEAWQMPQGGIDEGEDALKAAKRELWEETGVQKASLLAESKDWYHYDLPLELVPRIWSGKYRGQKQKWFVMHLDADDSHINIATKHPEFNEWRWQDLEALPELIVPFKKPLYQALVQEFLPIIRQAKGG